MIRHRRHDTGIEWTKRHVETMFIDFRKQNETYMRRFDNQSPIFPIHRCHTLRYCVKYVVVKKRFLHVKKHDGATSGHRNDHWCIVTKMNEITEHTKAKKRWNLFKQ